MNYQERIDELQRLLKQLETLGWNAYGIINERIAELRHARDAQSADDGYRTHPPGTDVTLTVRPSCKGLVSNATQADRERRYHVHGVRQVNDPMVLVDWGSGRRSWEYIRDLRSISEPPSHWPDVSIEVRQP